MIKKRGINLFMVTLLILSGCNKHPDSDLIGSKTCSPPCWMNIRPGATKTNDAISNLTTLESQGKGHLEIAQDGSINWYPSSSSNKIDYLYSRSDLIIEIKLDMRPSSTSLEEVISMFGDPSSFKFDRLAGGYFFVDLFYPDKGLAFTASGNKGGTQNGVTDFVVEPEVIVSFAYFMHPSDITGMVNSLYGANKAPEILFRVQEWKGYGTYILK